MPSDLDPAVRARLEQAYRNAYGSFPNWLCADIVTALAAYDAQAARLADIWLLVDLWERGTEGSLETLERLVALKETGCVD